MKIYTIQDDAGSQLQTGITMDGCHVVITLRTVDNKGIESKQDYLCGDENDLEGLINDLVELRKNLIELN